MPKNPQKLRPQIYPVGKTVTNVPKKSILFAVKALLLALVIRSYDYRPHLHPYAFGFVLLPHVPGARNCATSVCDARALFKFELEPQSNEPYFSTSLQDFWGLRWNLMVTKILRPTAYYPVLHFFTRVVGLRWARFLALMSAFAVSGLMHEVIYYYLTSVPPTWEVTWFFVLHGVCVAIEVEVKKAVADRWRLHPLVSRPLTLVFLAVTANWLFFPQLLRNGVDIKAINEYPIMVDFVKSHLPLNIIGGKASSYTKNL